MKLPLRCLVILTHGYTSGWEINEQSLKDYFSFTFFFFFVQVILYFIYLGTFKKIFGILKAIILGFIIKLP